MMAEIKYYLFIRSINEILTVEPLRRTLTGAARSWKGLIPCVR